MDEIVICDTNAVIQLAIICRKLLTDKGNGLDLVVHPKVIQEITGLKRNSEKYERLGDELDFITNRVTVSKEYQVPEKEEYDEMNETFVLMEYGIPAEDKSSPSSEVDRYFLILAKHNGLTLLTREKTLFFLGRMVLSIDKAWGISDAIYHAISNNIVSSKEIEAGIRKLKEKKETLPDRCIANLKGAIKI